MLQAYALHQSIENLGHHALFLQAIKTETPSYYKKIRACAKQSLTLLYRFLYPYFPSLVPPALRPSFMGRYFAHKYLKKDSFMSLNLSKTNSLNLDRLVVGSDQVWRCHYIQPLGGVDFFFLRFAPTALRQKSFAYAASFGSNEWEGNPEETAQCQTLLQDFQSISVREHSGIELCQEAFGIKALQMPDPTLLLQPEVYQSLIQKEQTSIPKQDFVATYILDQTKETQQTLHTITSQLHLTYQHLKPLSSEEHSTSPRPASVAQWLRSFRDSSYVVTDSFHGCVFAIIFNKPFICLGNKNRGSARFDSLLGTFGLQDRLFDNSSPDQLNQILSSDINWEKVNALLHSERKRGLAFLKQNLSQP